MTNPVMPATGVPLDGEDIGHPDNPPDSWTQGVMAAGLDEDRTAKHGRFFGDIPATAGLVPVVEFGGFFEVPATNRDAGQVIAVAPLTGPTFLASVTIETVAVALVDLSKTFGTGTKVAIMVGPDLGGVEPFTPGDPFDVGSSQLASFRDLFTLTVEEELTSSDLLFDRTRKIIPGLSPTQFDVWAVVIAAAGGFTAPTPDPGNAVIGVIGFASDVAYLPPPGS